MAEIDRLIAVGEAEIANHSAEAERLQTLADELMTSAEWHNRQAERWQHYLGQLATDQTVETPRPRHLFIVT